MPQPNTTVKLLLLHCVFLHGEINLLLDGICGCTAAVLLAADGKQKNHPLIHFSKSCKENIERKKRGSLLSYCLSCKFQISFF